MRDQELMDRVIELLDDFLHERIKPKQMIKEYNDTVSESLDWESTNEMIKEIGKFQEDLAFYVENPEWRKAHDDYYDDRILKKKVATFLARLKKDRPTG